MTSALAKLVITSTSQIISESLVSSQQFTCMCVRELRDKVRAQRLAMSIPNRAGHDRLFVFISAVCEQTLNEEEGSLLVPLNSQSLSMAR